MALILFSISGILVYGYLCLKMMSYSGVKTSRALKIVFSNFILFVPAGIILVALKTSRNKPDPACCLFRRDYLHLLPLYFENRSTDKENNERIKKLRTALRATKNCKLEEDIEADIEDRHIINISDQPYQLTYFLKRFINVAYRFWKRKGEQSS